MILLLATSAVAQTVPKLLPFQGHLTNAEGEVVDGEAKIVQFKIYDAPVSGAPVWAGEVHKLSVNQGLVNTLLGTKTAFPDRYGPDEGTVMFSKPLYLEITVDAQEEDADGHGIIDAADPPLLPRQVILPAVHAKTADQAAHADVADQLTNGITVSPSGNVGIGVDDPKAHLVVSNPFGASVSGSSGGHGVFATNLAVKSDGQLYTPSTHTNNYGYAGIHTTWGHLNFFASAGNTIQDQDVSPTPRMVIQHNGRVGIGTPDPATTLHVNGPIEYGSLRKLNVDDQFTATVRCADFTMGHSSRRGTPGRALVDLDNHLSINHRNDWEDGVVVGGPINVIGAVSMHGEAPIQFGVENFNKDISKGESLRIPSSDWIVAIVGFAATNGDIQEDDTGNPIYVYPYISGGMWHVTADVRSHNNHEEWKIWYMKIRKGLGQLVPNSGYGLR